jgi:hypothetical protein
MQQQQLKSLIENGQYQPEPALVAQAMLRRRGVRTLLAAAVVSSADRSPARHAARPQAA